MSETPHYNRQPDKLEKFKNIFDDSFYAEGYNYDGNRLNRIDLILEKNGKAYLMIVETYQSHTRRLAEQAEEQVFEDPTYVLPRNEILPSYLLDIKHGDWSEYEQYLIEQDSEENETLLDEDIIESMRIINTVKGYHEKDLPDLEFQALQQSATQKAAEDGIDLHKYIGPYFDCLEDLSRRANDFFVHPVTYETLETTQAAHQAWRLAKKKEGNPIYDGLTAKVNPFFVEYMTDICGYDNETIANKLIDLIIVNPRSVSFPDLINPKNNQTVATDLITRWWHNLSYDGLDSSQIIATLCGERQKNPENTILIGDIALKLLMKDSQVAAEIDRVINAAPNNDATQEEILEWVSKIGNLKGMRAAYTEVADELNK